MGELQLDVPVRELSRTTVALVERCVPRAGSRHDAEIRELRQTPAGGGVGRAQSLEELRADMCLHVTAMARIALGVADLLLAGQVRSAGGALELDGFGLNLIARSLAEMAGTANHLMDQDIDANERVRRYLVWRFDQLRGPRRFLAAMGAPVDDARTTTAEQEVLDLVERCKLSARPSRSIGPNVEHAALLGPGERRQSHPSATRLVTDAFDGQEGLYSLLSVGPHGDRAGLRSMVKKVDGDPAGGGRIHMSAFSVPPHQTVVLAVGALWRSGSLLADWCGVDARPLTVAAAELVR